MTQPDQLSHAFNDGKDDTWGTSGCHAVCMTMILNWYLYQNPLTQGKLQVPNMKAGEESLEMTPLLAAHWLWDPQSDPNQKQFVSSTQHPPYVPKKKEKSRHIDNSTGKFKSYSWQMDHAAIRQGMAGISFNGEALTVESFSMTSTVPHLLNNYRRARKLNSLPPDKDPLDDDGNYDPDKVSTIRQQKKSRLKQALLRGPVALNLNVPGHFVLLYGYRDSIMYICDPGAMIYKHWIQPNPATAPAQGMSTGPKKSINRNILAIDDKAMFSKIHDGGQNAELAFLDCLFYAENFYFKSLIGPQNYNATAMPTNFGPFGSLNTTKTQ